MTSAAAAPWRFDAIGTRWQIQTASPLGEAERTGILDLIDRFDRDWSRFRPDSLVRSIERGGRASAPPDAADMLELYAGLSDATGGAVNPLVGESLARRGYDAAYSFTDRGARPAPARWREVLGVSGGVLHVDAPAEATAEGGVVVDAGGDIRVLGAPAAPERIALEHPYDPSRAVGVWQLTTGALCASAVNRRAWGEGLHHVLDARTGEPMRQVAATWALAPTAMLADALATALFFDGGAELAHRRGVEWVRMTTSGRLEWSPGAVTAGADLFVGR